MKHILSGTKFHLFSPRVFLVPKTILILSQYFYKYIYPSFYSKMKLAALAESNHAFAFKTFIIHDH